MREQKIDTPFIVFSGKGRGKGTIDALSCDGVQYIDKFSKPEIVYKELSRSIRESAGKKDRKPSKAHTCKRAQPSC